jgi:hypothetical protein
MRARALVKLVMLLAARLAPGAQETPAEQPMLLELPRASVLVLDPASAATARDDRLMAALLAGCRTRFPVTSDDSARIARARVLAGASPDVSGSWPLVLVATGPAARPLPCERPELTRLMTSARDLTFASEPAAPDFTRPTRIALVRNDLIVPAQERLAGPGLVLTPSGLQASSASAVGVAFDLALLAPTRLGLPRDLRLAVWTPQSESPLLHALPPEVLRELWDRATPTRLSTAGTPGVDGELLRFALPRPRDRALAEAHRLHASGDYPNAVPAAVSRLRATGTRVRRDDRLSARLQLALTALAVGDTAVALVNFEQAKVAESCVRLAPDAPESARRLLDGLPTPPGACRPSSVAATFLRGLALPGFGHRASERWPLVGAVTVAALGGVALAAVQRDRVATAQYRSYLSIIPGANDHPGGAAAAIQAYDRAEATRVASVRLGQTAAVLWGLSVLDAFLGERRFRTRLAAVQQYGGVGLSLGVF